MGSHPEPPPEPSGGQVPPNQDQYVQNPNAFTQGPYAQGPYVQNPYSQTPFVAPQYIPSSGTSPATALVLSILGLVMCGVLAPFGMIAGKNRRDEIDRGVGNPNDRGTAQAAFVVGLIGTIILVLAVVAIVGLVALVSIGSTVTVTS